MSKDIQDDLVGIDYSKLRKHKRFEVTVECLLTDLKTKKTESALLTTISVGGVTILYSELLTKGDTYSIEFTMPNGAPVTKTIEVRWFDTELTKATHDGESQEGFEHGCKFILLDKIIKKKAPLKPKKVASVASEKLISCHYHLELYRELGNIMRHAYVNQVGDKHIYFSTLTELKISEKLKVNMVLTDSGLFNERKMTVKVLGVKRSGKQFSVKAVKV